MDGCTTAADLRTMGVPEAARVTSGARILVETMPIPDGPLAGMLRAARDALCAEVLARGLTPIVSEDWSELERLNLRHRTGWFPLLPKPASAPAFWLGAVDAEGQTVATHAAVLLDCRERSFGERVTDLSVFRDPGDMPAAEWAFCASEAAHETRGTVAWIVAGWTRPDQRGRGIFHPLGALVRLLAAAQWRPQWVVGMVDPETVPVWSGRGAGRRRLEARPGILYQQAGVGRLPLHFMRWSRAAVLSDLHGAT